MRAKWQDVVNSGLEVAAVLAVVASIFDTLKHHNVEGYSPFHMLYSFTSASWFIYYYWHLRQWWSFVGGFGYFVAVALWASLMIAFH